MVDENLSRGERTRVEIIRAAHNLFVHQGYHGTSMRQIARDAKIALGGLYNHFASKEAVFEAVFIEYHPYNDFLPAMLKAQGGTIEEMVRDGARRVIKAVNDRPDFLNLMFIEIVEFKSIHVHQLVPRLMPFGLQIAQKIASAGGNQLRPMPLPMLIRTFLGMFFAYYLTELIIAAALPPEFSQDAMQSFIEIYLHGILVDEKDSTNPDAPALGVGKKEL